MNGENDSLTSTNWRTRAVWIAVVLALSVIVRAGTAQFLSTHLYDGGWFQYGSYSVFDIRAQNILDGVEPAFFLSDPERTDLVQYPPGFPMMLAAIYAVTGERSPYSAQRVMWIADAFLTPLLIIGIGVTVFGWRCGLAAGGFASISPMLAFCGATPSADAPTSWLILGAVWLAALAVKRESPRLALASGTVLGMACWFRVNPLFLAIVLAVVALVSASGRKRMQIGLAIALGAVLMVTPIVVRNLVVYREFMLTGLNAGTNLWEGLGETELGRQNGFRYGDHEMLEVERAAAGVAPDARYELNYPDGIRRDRERTRASLEFISQHPVWYAGVAFERMYWMLKIAGQPGQYYGTSGINCTPEKCLAEGSRGGLVAGGITVLGWLQSVSRFVAIPLAAAGVIFGWMLSRRLAVLPLAAVIYYLFTSSLAHTELRYVLPMHALLVVFAGAAVAELPRLALRLRR